MRLAKIANASYELECRMPYQTLIRSAVDKYGEEMEADVLSGDTLPTAVRR